MPLNNHTYAKEDFKLSDYAERLDSVSKEQYLAKLTIQKTDGSYFHLQDPYLINNDLWKNDASLWPKITESDIRNYIASGPGRNSKSLSAYEYVVSGGFIAGISGLSCEINNFVKELHQRLVKKDANGITVSLEKLSVMLKSSVPGKTSKVLICGYRSSGKTSILEQLIYGNFPCYAYPTIEDIYCALVNTDRGVKEKLRFYDTAGTVPGQSTDFLKTYMQYAEGVVLVYAINSRESFQLLDQVKKEYDKNKEKKEVPIIVLGNKMDLQNERQVDIVLAQAWAQKEKVKLYEVSAVDRRTLTDPFVYLASKMNPPPSKSTFPQLGKKGKPGSITMEL